MKYGISLFVLSIVISFVLLNPVVKSKTMSLFLDTQREVLSKMDFQQQGTTYQVAKIQNKQGLAVELYKTDGQELVFLDRQQLTDKKDAYYKFDETKHNLFLKDINEDGLPEIILPSIDKNMKARLNVFSFDPTNETLKKVSAH